MPSTDPMLAPWLAEQLATHEPKLRAFLQRLLARNRELNLTAIREPELAWERHVVESSLLVPRLGESGALLDLGSGGGVPGLVLAILCPRLRVTLLDATQKKTRFLAEVATELELANVTVLTGRAESLACPGQPHREAYDWVTARAVAALPVLLELAVPFLKVGAKLLAVKGERAEEELAEAADAARVLKVSLVSRERHPTATVLVFAKNAPTPPKYPRRPGEPNKRPL